MDPWIQAMTDRQLLIIRKDPGDMGIGTMLMVIAFLLLGLILIAYVLQLRELRLVKNLLTDGLELTSLAAAVPDDTAMEAEQSGFYYYDEASECYRVSTAGTDSARPVLDEELTYRNFLELFSENLACGEGMLTDASGNSRLYSWRLETLIIYNVTDEETAEAVYDETGLVERRIHVRSVGEAMAPDGSEVTETTIFCRIGFSYRDLLGKAHDGLSMEQLSAVRTAG